MDLQQGGGLAQGLIRLQVLSHAGRHPGADWRASLLQRLRGCVIRPPSAVQAAGPCMLQPLQGSWPLRPLAAHPCTTLQMRACIGDLHCWRSCALSPGLASVTPTNQLRYSCQEGRTSGCHAGQRAPEAGKGLRLALGQLIGPVGALKDAGREHVRVPALVYGAQEVYRDVHSQQLPLLFKALQILVKGLPAHLRQSWKVFRLVSESMSILHLVVVRHYKEGLQVTATTLQADRNFLICQVFTQ